MGGSSPDLVSRRNLHNLTNNVTTSAGRLHKTLDNLNRLPAENGDEDEPIYQNQSQLREEPIYQNQFELERQRLMEQEQQQQQQQQHQQQKTTTSTVAAAKAPQATKLRGHVSRVAITNSRENLSLGAAGDDSRQPANLNFVYEEGGVIHSKIGSSNITCTYTSIATATCLILLSHIVNASYT